MNIVTLTGRAAKEIELKFTQNGKAVANGTIAVQRKFKNAEGKYDADFINFVAWGKGGELMAQYIKKGDKFGVSGQIQTRNFENSEGKKIYITEVNVQDFDFPDNSKGGQAPKQETPPKQETKQNDPFASDGKPIDINDDDLPF